MVFEVDLCVSLWVMVIITFRQLFLIWIVIIYYHRQQLHRAVNQYRVF
jgi:hypothetical protein